MRTRSCRRFVLSVLILSSVAHAEIIGDFLIVDTPVDAVVTHGGGATFTWLNVAQEPASIPTAFTGFSVIDDGYTNAAAGTRIELTFADGALRNGVGPDLVLLDADLDLNVYFVTISYDNFSQLHVISNFVDTGVDRTYYSGAGGEPRSYDIYAATIDLSLFDVPAGEAVQRVRIFTEGPSGDPLALAVLLSTCPADIDGNGEIELSDLTLLLAAFGSAPGEAAWNPHADLNADGSIGLADLADLLANFGQPC